MTDRLRALHDAGVSIWADTLSRDLLDSGEFARLVSECSVTGATSNPTIFETAITDSHSYDLQLAELIESGVQDPQELFFALAFSDVRHAADLLRPVYDETSGADGYISFECTPDLAYDTDRTVEQARELWRRIDRPNAMIKVPATTAGIDAIEVLTAEGINVNVTLLFSVDRYAQVLEAYLAGLEHRLRQGMDLRHVASVASFFVSRVDSEADLVLPKTSPLCGKVAIANAAAAYLLYCELMGMSRWRQLAAAGARPQRPLWASTGTKNPAYSDLLYVESLIARGVVNTMPLRTLHAFADHGDASGRISSLIPEARLLSGASASGLDLAGIATELERRGVDKFCTSYTELLRCIGRRATAIASPPSYTPTP